MISGKLEKEENGGSIRLKWSLRFGETKPLFCGFGAFIRKGKKSIKQKRIPEQTICAYNALNDSLLRASKKTTKNAYRNNNNYK